MARLVFLLNAFMTLSFGLFAFVAPVAAFAGFGIGVEGAVSGIVRGYAATCIGYGVIMALMRDAAEPGLLRALLIGSLLFNALEVLAQVPLAISGQVSPMIWVTVTGHAVAAILSVVCLSRGNADASRA